MNNAVKLCDDFLAKAAEVTAIVDKLLEDAENADNSTPWDGAPKPDPAKPAEGGSPGQPSVD